MLLLLQNPPISEPLPTPQLVLALTLAISMLIIVVELVRRQKLREEYAFLWIGTAIVLMALALNSNILGWLGEITQAASPLSILFFGAHVFLMMVALQFSVRLTKLTFRSKTLGQRLALLERQLEDLTARVDDSVVDSASQEALSQESREPEAAKPASEPREL